MTTEGRDDKGRFAQGYAGGPGRPRRATEAAYMRALSDALSLEDWRAIVQGAIAAAKDGDGKAREWLARYALGDAPLSFTDLAMRDELELNDDDELQQAITDATRSPLDFEIGSQTRIAQMVRLREKAKREAAEAEAAEERRKQREARKASAAAPKA